MWKQTKRNIPSVEAFVADFRSHLFGIVPDDYLSALADEQVFWLERRIRDEVLAGRSFEEGTVEVLRKHGSAGNIAQKCLAEYYEEEIRSPIYRLVGRANTTANTVFGLANAFYLCFLNLRVYLPNTSPIVSSINPAQARSLFPEPLPYPDMTWQFWVTVGFPILAPLAAGWLCGRLIPVGSASAVYRVLMYMIVTAFMLGAALFPQKDALVYAVWLTIYWLPVGCLTAHLSSSLLRRSKRRTFERNRTTLSLSPNLKDCLPI